MASPIASSASTATPAASRRGCSRLETRIASGTAMGSKYRAEPAKKITSAAAKNTAIHQHKKSFNRDRHQKITRDPTPQEIQNSGLRSTNAAATVTNAEPMRTQTGPRQNASSDKAGKTSHPVCP